MEPNNVLKFPKLVRPSSYVADMGISPSASALYETILMFRVQWIFPDCTVRGVPHHYHTSPSTGDKYCIADGYRCEVCKRVFFAADLNYVHECMEADQ